MTDLKAINCNHEFVTVPLIIEHVQTGEITICRNCLLTETEIDQSKNIDNLLAEVERLTAKLDAAERDKKRYYDLIHRQSQRNINVIGKMEKAERERDQLQAANDVLRMALVKARSWHRTPLEKPSDDGEHMEWDGRSFIEDDVAKSITKALSTTPPAAYARLKALEEVETLGNKLIRSVTYNSTGVFVPEKHFNDFVDALQRLEEVGK